MCTHQHDFIPASVFWGCCASSRFLYSHHREQVQSLRRKIRVASGVDGARMCDGEREGGNIGVAAGGGDPFREAFNLLGSIVDFQAQQQARDRCGFCAIFCSTFRLQYVVRSKRTAVEGVVDPEKREASSPLRSRHRRLGEDSGSVYVRYATELYSHLRYSSSSVLRM